MELTPTILRSLKKPRYDIPSRLLEMLKRLSTEPIRPRRMASYPEARAPHPETSWRTAALPAAAKATPTATVEEILLSLLNKLSDANYATVRDQMKEVLSGAPDDVLLLTRLAEAFYACGCEGIRYATLYVRLVLDLDNQVLLNLVGKRHREFVATFQNPLPSVDMTNGHEELSDPTERAQAQARDYEAYCAQTQQKLRRRGGAFWIASLARVHILTDRNVLDVVGPLLVGLKEEVRGGEANHDQSHEYVECLVEIGKTLPRSETDRLIRRELGALLKLGADKRKGMTKRTQYKIQDYIES